MGYPSGVKGLLSVLFLSLLLLPGQGQARTHTAGATGIVRQIIIEGASRVDPETILSHMQLAPGDAYDAGVLDAVVKRLFATGFFSDVAPEDRDGVIYVRVTENPVISRIAFEGNTSISDAILSREIALSPRESLTGARVRDDTGRILDLYRRFGHFAAVVRPQIIPRQGNRVDLVFEIDERAGTKISGIKFVGNTRFDDDRLRSVIASRETRFWRFLSTTDSFDSDRLNEDGELLRRFYLSRGHADFSVLSAVGQFTLDKLDFLVTYTLEEGPVYTFGELSVESTVADIDARELERLITAESGDPYSIVALEETVEALTFELGRRGYAFVRVRPRPDKDNRNRTISVRFLLEEGERVFVEAINISGNLRTLDRVIRREMQIVEGSVFDALALRNSRYRIRGLGFFETVEITPRHGSAPDRIILDVVVSERSTGSISVAGGYSTTDKLLLRLGFEERNLLGRGQEIDLSVSTSSRQRALNFGFTEPYFLERDLAAGFDIIMQRDDREDTSGYTLTTRGGNLRAVAPVTDRLSLSLVYRYRRSRISGSLSSLSQFLQHEQSAGVSVTSSIGYTLIYDRRDDPIDPRDGYILRAGQEIAGIGSTNRRFIRTTGVGRFYLAPVQDVDLVLETTAEAGHIRGYGGRRVDYTGRFYIGGDDFRGFELWGIGPRDTLSGNALGGEQYYLLTTEAVFPVGLPEEFAMSGRVWGQVGSLWGLDVPDGLVCRNPKDTGDVVPCDSIIGASRSARMAVGIGLSWNSPVGLIRIDYGKAVRKESFDRVESFRITFGASF